MRKRKPSFEYLVLYDPSLGRVVQIGKLLFISFLYKNKQKGTLDVLDFVLSVMRGARINL
jgi:hypothetical protein